MSPSRGLQFLRRTRICTRRSQVRSYSDFVKQATSSDKKAQIYISKSSDPYLNLSIEHYLLQKTPETSTVLFLYANRPSVVIGRNQNPWTEVNIGALGSGANAKYELVRRRSGGGTVFHDEGNHNYCVICPSAVFHRDKHAEMVVKALKDLSVEGARVNCRHDIVVDKVPQGEQQAIPFKVSGSAFKITRLRSLHHGTCLLDSKNLGQISSILRSPAKQFINGRGVESVSSPVSNVNLANKDFVSAVTHQFIGLYGSENHVIEVGDSEAEIPEIAKGIKELKSEEWIYGQTPQFEFSSGMFLEKMKGKQGLNQLPTFPDRFEADFTARHGRITEVSIKYNNSELISHLQESEICSSLLDMPLHKIKDWRRFLSPGNMHSSEDSERLQAITAPGETLNLLFGVGDK